MPNSHAASHTSPHQTAKCAYVTAARPGFQVYTIMSGGNYKLYSFIPHEPMKNFTGYCRRVVYSYELIHQPRGRLSLSHLCGGERSFTFANVTCFPVLMCFSFYSGETRARYFVERNYLTGKYALSSEEFLERFALRNKQRQLKVTKLEILGVRM